MGKINQPAAVKLIIGLIYKEEETLRIAQKNLVKSFGIIDYSSQEIPFTYTDYYEKEFGRNLKRKFISFKKLILPGDLPKIKTATNKIETRLSRKNKRLINIDPGYLDLAKLVLATTKDYAHRIYLNKGIYAEVTLFYRHNTFESWQWTYPDYRTPDYIEIFNRIRDIYDDEIKGK